VTEPAQTPAGGSAPATVSHPGRRWWWLVALVVVAGGVGAWQLTGGDGATTPVAAPTELRFAEVVVADLVEEESYDGTLGTLAGDPIRAQGQGTLTWVVDPGTELAEGDILFAIDEQPVVLMEGEVPSYRTLATVEDDTVAGITNRLSGTVTRVSEPGVFEQGDILYWVDEQPVVLLYGDLPQYRSINLPRRGDVSGPDVSQLKAALISLGYDPDGRVGDGDTFGSRAEDMVEDWQEDNGATVDGSIDMGEVIFAPGPIEVTEFLIEVGDSLGAGQPVAELPDDEDQETLEGGDVLQLEAALVRLGFGLDGALVVDGVWDESTEAAVLAWEASIGAEPDGVVERGDIVFMTGTTRALEQLVPVGSTVNSGTGVLAISSAEKLVSLDLPAADQGLRAVGDHVTVELPDGTEAGATVTEVASIATGTNQNATFAVTIALDDPAVAGSLDEAPVEIHVVTDDALGVKAVPVTALLVLAEGGYAAQVDDGAGGTRLVAVEPGFFADGLVEIETDGLEIGDRVVIP
jgi:peptidoglycan hydrolase-like protein with peptidoglycan-binding domain